MEKHQHLEYWTLDQLRACGHATPIPPPASATDFQEVRPGKLRKVYPSPQNVWLYRPTRFRGFYFDMPSESPRSPEELSERVDKRTLGGLYAQANDALRQMMVRAASGDERALDFLVFRIFGLVKALEILENRHPDKLRALAERHPRWPVLLSLTPCEIRLATDRLRKLNVGKKAITPTGAGRKVQRSLFFARLADWAVDECYNVTRITVPILEHHATHARAKTKRTAKIWRTRVQSTWYALPDGAICIADWEKQCTHLTTPITKANLPNWWKAIKSFVLEYWDG